MFIDALKRQNPALISAAIALWQQGKIAPDSWVIDVDQVIENGKRLLDVAGQHGISLYLMTKQVGRNPWLAEKLLQLGYEGIVVVDYKESRVMRRAGLPVAHQGHLVQIPSRLVNEAVAQGTEVITLFSLEKAREVSAAAVKAGCEQNVMLKVYDKDDFLYPGQESGFPLMYLTDVVNEIRRLPGLRLSGLTHFPCLLWDENSAQTMPTPNLHTLVNARRQLVEAGIAIEQLNAPSASSCSSLPLLAEYGVTHAEPGHALTGTIPSNQKGDQPERIAMLWLSEISHNFRGDSYCYGGGYYRRGHAQNALVFTPENDAPIAAKLKPVDDSSIDYYLPVAGEFPVSSAVIFCFRTQIFAPGVMKPSESAVWGVAELQHEGGDTFMGHQEILGTRPQAPLRMPFSDVIDRVEQVLKAAGWQVERRGGELAFLWVNDAVAVGDNLEADLGQVYNVTANLSAIAFDEVLKIGRVVREQVQVGRVITFGGQLANSQRILDAAETMEGRFVGINAPRSGAYESGFQVRHMGFGVDEQVQVPQKLHDAGIPTGAAGKTW